MGSVIPLNLSRRFFSFPVFRLGPRGSALTDPQSGSSGKLVVEDRKVSLMSVERVVIPLMVEARADSRAARV